MLMLQLCRDRRIALVAMKNGHPPRYTVQAIGLNEIKLVGSLIRYPAVANNFQCFEDLCLDYLGCRYWIKHLALFFQFKF